VYGASIAYSPIMAYNYCSELVYSLAFAIVTIQVRERYRLIRCMQLSLIVLTIVLMLVLLAMVATAVGDDRGSYATS